MKQKGNLDKGKSWIIYWFILAVQHLVDWLIRLLFWKKGWFLTEHLLCMLTHRHRWEGIDAHAGQRYQDDANTDQRHDLGVKEDEKTGDASLVLF